MASNKVGSQIIAFNVKVTPLFDFQECLIIVLDVRTCAAEEVKLKSAKCVAEILKDKVCEIQLGTQLNMLTETIADRVR